MFWLVFFSILGLVICIFLMNREKGDFSRMFPLILFVALGILVGVIFGAISTFVVNRICEDDHYEYFDTKLYDIAVSESGDSLNLDVVFDKNSSFISFIDGENNFKSIKLQNCKVEFVDSDFCVVRRSKRISGWYRIFVFADNTTVLRISQAEWERAVE